MPRVTCLSWRVGRYRFRLRDGVLEAAEFGGFNGGCYFPIVGLWDKWFDSTDPKSLVNLSKTIVREREEHNDVSTES